MTIKIIPAISTLRSVERGVCTGAGAAVFLRCVVVLEAPVVRERVVPEVVFLVRLGVLVVLPVFFLLPDVFFVLLVDVLRAIAIQLTFPCSSNYSIEF